MSYKDQRCHSEESAFSGRHKSNSRFLAQPRLTARPGSE